MSMLEKFRKSGGFSQLVQIVEICEAHQQKNMLQLIASEDPGWAHLVKVKLLSFEKIINWPDHVLMQIISSFDIPVLSALYTSADDLQRGQLLNAIPQKQSQEIQAYLQSNTISADQKSAAKIKLIQQARQLESMGKISLNEIDKTLVIDQKIAA